MREPIAKRSADGRQVGIPYGVQDGRRQGIQDDFMPDTTSASRKGSKKDAAKLFKDDLRFHALCCLTSTVHRLLEKLIQL
jgi:hypothetical protein